MLCPFNLSQRRNCRSEINYPSIHYTEKINTTLNLWIKQKCFQTLFLHVMSFLDVPPLSFSLRMPQLSGRDWEEIHIPGRVFVSNRSAGAAPVAGISITSVVPFLPYMDQLLVSG